MRFTRYASRDTLHEMRFTRYASRFTYYEVLMMAQKTESEIGNPQFLRVLMVEDSEDDVLLILRELKKGGYAPECERVETPEGMINALSGKHWDIILCDYHLPCFSALEALAIIKKLNIDIPVMIVSGAIGEEMALDCIHRGAHDYIMKGNLTRLGVAIARELEKKEIRIRSTQAEEALCQSEEKYRTILERIEDGYYETDLSGKFTFFNAALCRIWGYPPEEILGMKPSEYADQETARKIYSVHNQTYRTGEPGRLFGYDIIRKDGSVRHVQTSFTLIKDSAGLPTGFSGVARDITELKMLEMERQEGADRLRKSLGATINAMAVTVETRDPYTAGHQRRVADLVQTIAVEMHLEDKLVDGLRLACMIHDLGKISIPSEILTKPTKLTDIELQIVRMHAQAGYDILKDIDFPWPIARMVIEHHERLDGSGYPNQLTGDDILLESKILAVADVVEAMASHRPYRPSLGLDEAKDEILKNRGILYDAEVVDACLRLFEEKRFSFEIVKNEDPYLVKREA